MSDNWAEDVLAERNKNWAEKELRRRGVPVAEFARRAGNIALEAPRIAGDTLAGAASVPAFLKGLVPGGEGPVEAGSREFTEQQQKFPASFLRSFNDDKGLDLPDVNQLLAAGKSVPALLPGGESPKESFNRNLGEIDVQEMRNKMEFPKSTGAAEILADVGAMLLTKKPAAGTIVNTEKRLMSIKPIEFGSAVSAAAAKPGWVQAMKEFLETPAMRHMARGSGRSVEAGAEAAMLEIINGDDPFQTAMIAAGTQSGSSLLLAALKGKVGGAGGIGLRVAAAGAGTAAIYQVIKEAIPGGKDYILESLEFGYSKVLIAAALGLASGAVGGGRLRGKNTVLQRNQPLIMDAVNTIHRGVFLDLLALNVEGTPEQVAQIDQTLDLITTNPDAFPDDIKRQIEASFKDGTFVDVVGRLVAESKDFRRVLFTHSPPPQLPRATDNERLSLLDRAGP